MRPSYPLFLSLVLLPVAFSGSLRAADAADNTEARLRAALRDAMLQLRDAQTEVANLRGAQSSLTDQNKSLTAQLETLKRQTAENQSAADKVIAGLKAQVATQDEAVTQLRADLAKWKKAYEDAAASARQVEGERTRLENENQVLQRTVADRERKNLELFQLGNEILTRYEKFSLGEALRAKEPFVGATRTRLENLVQDYADKLAAQTATP